MNVNGEALQLHAVYKKVAFLLQVTCMRICISTTSHVRIVSVLQVMHAAYESAMKLKVRMIKSLSP